MSLCAGGALGDPSLTRSHLVSMSRDHQPHFRNSFRECDGPAQGPSQWEEDSQEYFLEEAAWHRADRMGHLTGPRDRVLVFWGRSRGAWELSGGPASVGQSVSEAWGHLLS